MAAGWTPSVCGLEKQLESVATTLGHGLPGRALNVLPA